MITAKIFRNSRGAVSGFEISGHAGYAEHGGDIVCAAVSAIAYTAAGYFSEKKYGGKPLEYSEREGFMKLSADRRRSSGRQSGGRRRAGGRGNRPEADCIFIRNGIYKGD